MEKKTINLGRVGFAPKGAYSPEVTYGRMHVVTYKNTTYWSKQEDNLNHEPNGETEWWGVLVDGQAAYNGANDAVKATERANTAAEKADAATEKANSATSKAVVATDTVNAAVTNANDATAKAKKATEVCEAIVPVEDARVKAESSRAEAESSRVSAEQSRATAEQSRGEAESQRTAAEAKRNTDELSRQSNETDRKEAEAARVETEQSRVDAEQSRVAAEKQREATLAKTKADCDAATQKATDAANEATLAKTKAEDATDNCNTATAGAEKVDARLDGNVLTVTRRTGEEQSVNLTDSDEHITVNCSTNVEGKSVEGLVLNVYVNNGSTPHQYTTDSNGQTSFSVEKGATYRIVLPYIEGCAAPDPIQHIAAVGSRIIDVAYVDEAEVFETLTIKVNKAGDDDVYSAWEGFTVHVTVGGETTDHTTDSNGKVELKFKIGTSYTINVDKIEGMWEAMDRYSVTRTAAASSYRINLSFHTYESGIWLIDDEDKQYTYDEWDASGKSSDHLVFIRIATMETQKYSGDILISIDKMSDFAKVSASKQWASQNVEFKNIPLDGNNKNYANWGRFAYNGLLATQTIIAEGDERSIETPACDWCYNFEVESNGKTYKGYLPTLYQRKIFIANIDMIMEGLVMKYPDMGSGKSSFLTNWWTSTQYYANYSWYCGGSTTSYSGKSSGVTAVPFFACLSTSPSLLLSSGSKDVSSNVVA